jgi:preprotein translocase subunit SecE
LQVRFLSALQVGIPMSAHERCNEVARKVIDEPSEDVVANAKKERAAKRNPFARIALFIRQVIGELKKVVTPTRKELLSYTGVVLVFVVIMMALVSLLDWVFGLGVVWVFGNPA